MINESNPWTIISSNKVLENDWITVTDNKVLNPNGHKGVYGLVHFKNLAIGIIPIDENGNTFLVGQYRLPINQYSWEIPEGGGGLNIHPIESAKRELKEETGIIASDYQEIVRMHLSNSVTDELAIIYVAKKLTFHNPTPEDCEQLQVKKISIKKAFEMVENKLITDSMSVAGLLKLELMMLKNNIQL